MSRNLYFYLFMVIVPLVVIAITATSLMDGIQTARPAAAEVPVQSLTAADRGARLITGRPQRLVIPSADINIVVRPGDFSAATNSWTLSTDAAHYATATVAPNNRRGNTFIYGHNTPQVLGRLHQLSAGARAFVHVKGGRVFEYQLAYRQTVAPEDLSLFKYQGPPVLSLQTCSGLWNEQRDILWFKFVTAS